MSRALLMTDESVGAGMLLMLWAILMPVYIAIVQVLWNKLAPDLFESKRISYWQALGLVALAYLLLGVPSSF